MWNSDKIIMCPHHKCTAGNLKKKNQNVVAFIHSVMTCLYKCIETSEKNVIYMFKFYFC